MLIACTLDLAREQSLLPTRIIRILRDCHAAGYNAVGLYLEHRFEYASAPWAAAPGCITPAAVQTIQDAAREIGVRVIPFINTLGHLEGFLRTAAGAHLAEQHDGLTLQLCPSLPAARAFARNLVADCISAFSDPVIHLGGDEAHHLGACPRCKPIAERDGAWILYADHYADLCRVALDHDRRPALWADMLLKHPAAFERLPRETLLFNWHYDNDPAPTTRTLQDAGFEVVTCPSVHSYDSAWCFLDTTEANVDAHRAAHATLNTAGVCVTTWEFCYFSELFSVLPVLCAAGRRLAREESWEAAYSAIATDAERDAFCILGREIPAADPFLAPGTWRNLRRAVVYALDPFELSRRWRPSAGIRQRLLRLIQSARQNLPPEHPLHWPLALHETALEWTRLVERAESAFAAADHPAAVAALAEGAASFEQLRPRLRRIAEQGGSGADITRLARLIQRIWDVIGHIEQLAPNAPARPAFHVVTQPRYLPGSQAGWELAH